MSSIQLQLRTLLLNATDAGARVYSVVADFGTARPYVTFQRVAVAPEFASDGDTHLCNTRIQIDVFADSMPAAEVIAAQIAALMAGWSVQNVPVLGQDFYEDEVKLFRVSTDYSVWHSTP